MKNQSVIFSFLVCIFIIFQPCLVYCQSISYDIKDFDSLVQGNKIKKPIDYLITSKMEDTLYVLQYFSLFNRIETIPIAILNKGGIKKVFNLGGDLYYVQNDLGLMQSVLKSIHINSMDTIYKIEQTMLDEPKHYLKESENYNTFRMVRTLYYSSNKGLYKIIYEPIIGNKPPYLCWFYKEGDFYNIFQINNQCN